VGGVDEEEGAGGGGGLGWGFPLPPPKVTVPPRDSHGFGPSDLDFFLFSSASFLSNVETN
jgi:hypothetical protein